VVALVVAEKELLDHKDFLAQQALLVQTVLGLTTRVTLTME
jgi:hypothetical protein